MQLDAARTDSTRSTYPSPSTSPTGRELFGPLALACHDSVELARPLALPGHTLSPLDDMRSTSAKPSPLKSGTTPNAVVFGASCVPSRVSSQVGLDEPPALPPSAGEPPSTTCQNTVPADSGTSTVVEEPWTFFWKRGFTQPRSLHTITNESEDPGEGIHLRVGCRVPTVVPELGRSSFGGGETHTVPLFTYGASQTNEQPSWLQVGVAFAGAVHVVQLAPHSVTLVSDAQCAGLPPAAGQE